MPSYCMHIEVQSALTNWKLKDFRGMFRDKAGKPLTPHEAKAFLCGELARGRRLIPCGTCDHFDYVERGCLGHDGQP
jgi:hypothetical protein